MHRTTNEHDSYEDILHLPRPISTTRLPMSRLDRAAQFAPFKSLVGLENAMEEMQRQTKQKIELDESEKSLLNEKLRILQERIAQNPSVSLVYFCPDLLKEGGRYCEISGALRRIDTVEKVLLLTNDVQIPLSDLYSIEF